MAAESPGHLTVAVVEDDRSLREEVVSYLEGRGFSVRSANSGAGLDDLLLTDKIDIFVIDLNLPGENGLSICNRLRRTMPQAGIVIMTARVGLTDRLAGYPFGGADFYMPKPIMPEELLQVLLSLGRRVKVGVVDQGWTLNLRDRTLSSPQTQEKLRLTHREKVLLLALAQAKDNQLESALICDVFAQEDDSEPMSKHALEELVARLRKKFRAVQSASEEPAIKSIWGFGYALCISVVLA
ncbi:MAG: response regulator transcription factor [Betaproteobacteria bacterium]